MSGTLSLYGTSTQPVQIADRGRIAQQIRGPEEPDAVVPHVRICGESKATELV